MDVLDTFDEVRICVAYRHNGRKLDSLPASVAVAEQVEPVYETLPGWKTDLTGVRQWDELPQTARDYLERLGQIIGTEVAVVGVGPERDQSIFKPGSWLVRQLDL